MNGYCNEEVWSHTVSASSFGTGMIQSTGTRRESEGTLPWKVGVGDFIKPVPIVRERAGAGSGSAEGPPAEVHFGDFYRTA